MSMSWTFLKKQEARSLDLRTYTYHAPHVAWWAGRPLDTRVSLPHPTPGPQPRREPLGDGQGVRVDPLLGLPASKSEGRPLCLPVRRTDRRH